jgi:hypothetical protein
LWRAFLRRALFRRHLDRHCPSDLVYHPRLLESFPYSGSLLLMALTSVWVAIPTAGGIGGFHLFLSIGLVLFFSDYTSSSDRYSQAAGISNGAYVISMVPLFLLGLFFLSSEGLSFGVISTAEPRPMPVDTRELSST